VDGKPENVTYCFFLLSGRNKYMKLTFRSAQVKWRPLSLANILLRPLFNSASVKRRFFYFLNQGILGFYRLVIFIKVLYTDAPI
jgi:hypothetical protein